MPFKLRQSYPLHKDIVGFCDEGHRINTQLQRWAVCNKHAQIRYHDRNIPPKRQSQFDGSLYKTSKINPKPGYPQKLWITLWKVWDQLDKRAVI